MNNEVNEWKKKFDAAVAAYVKPEEFFVAPPKEMPKTKEERAAYCKTLLAARSKLSIADSNPRFCFETGARFIFNHLGEMKRHWLAEMIAKTAAFMDDRIAELLEAGVPAFELGLIRQADFPSVEYLWNGENKPKYVIGLVQFLPDGHPLKKILPPADFYQFLTASGSFPSLILGLQDGADKPWFVLQSALNLTKRRRDEQKAREAEREHERHLEEQKRKEDFWRSPLGQKIREQEEIKRLKESGQVPEYVEPQPAVRGIR